MSGSELAEIEALLLRVLPDPMGFAERLLGELAERLAATPASSPPDVVQGSFELPSDQSLVDRNVLLAAALGACDCWGEDPECDECSGEGTVAWVPPDPELYDEYVKPAVMRASTDDAAAGKHRAVNEPVYQGSDEGGNR